jgi:hypothetical protein
MGGVEVQWRVTWFPPDAPDRSFTHMSENNVRQIARREAEWNPLIEHREIVTGDWVMEREGVVPDG